MTKFKLRSRKMKLILNKVVLEIRCYGNPGEIRDHFELLLVE